MLFEIKNRWNGEIIFKLETESLKLCVETAVKAKADLSLADLSSVRDDLWAVLSSSPQEVAGLRQALIKGRVDGSTYEGACACLVGTIANVAHVKYLDLPILKPNESRPAERFFLAINKGDTPKNNHFSKMALEWIDQWLENMRGAFAK